MTARQRWRRRLLLAGLLPLALALALAVKVGLMYQRADQGRVALESGAADAARGHYGANATVNVFEPWIASYDEGVAAYRQGDVEGAVSLFGRARAEAPPDQQCRVRTNLALSLEARADAATADEPGQAALWWHQAREELAPCLHRADRRGLAPVGPEASVDDRLRSKLDAAAARAERATDDRTVEDQDEYADLYAALTDGRQLTPAQRRELLDRLNEEGRRTRNRDRRPRPPKPPPPSNPSDDPEPEAPVLNW